MSERYTRLQLELTEKGQQILVASLIGEGRLRENERLVSLLRENGMDEAAKLAQLEYEVVSELDETDDSCDSATRAENSRIIEIIQTELLWKNQDEGFIAGLKWVLDNIKISVLE
jgi:hypothetical protein